MKKGKIILLTVACLLVPILTIGMAYYFFEMNIFDNPDFWYGYMSYFGTVVLATIAIWQNIVFKEENDKSQARLEALTKQANELSIIRKIIENETQNFSRLQAAFNEFSYACDPEMLHSVYGKCINLHGLDEDNNAVLNPVVIRTEMHTLRNQIEHSLTSLYREMGLFDDKENPDRKLIDEYYEAAKQWVDKIIKSSTPDRTEIRKFNDIKKSFIEYREKYLSEKLEKINSIIYNNMTLEEIKKLCDL